MNNIAASAAGAPLASKRQLKLRKQREAEAANRRADDEFESTVAETEQIDSVRDIKDSTQEESREDREEHGVGYTPRALKRGGDHPKLDLSA